ncbi:hypothetical protein E0Z10_g9064 [Xylaria hypoxylon]|uniref:Uncharacterized protein n=1 Tax=Xylaria hypoxylon TaxID=37992 RepID=A0A4Z0YKE6_9PEZI|nr:hypothetical protein E0Z10_g9064 [Xylaria hypoxylon]
MSGYTGRRGHPVNVSQLLQDLNRIPEPATQPDDNLPSLDDELAMFTNTNFIDWDAGTPHGSGSASASGQETPSTTSPTTERAPSDAVSGDMSNFDFNLSGYFLALGPFYFRRYPLHFLSEWISACYSAEHRGIPQKTTSCTTDAFHGFFANCLLPKPGTRRTPPQIPSPGAVIGSLAKTWGAYPGKRLKVHSLDRIACYGAIYPMVQFPVILM